MNQLPPTTISRPSDQQERDPLMEFAKRWWWLLAVGAIIGISVAVIYSRIGPIPYQSTALLQVVTPAGSTTTQNAEQARSASTNFAAEVGSPRIYALTSEALAGTLDISASELEAMERSGSLETSPMRSSNFIRIVVTDEDPERAQTIANTIARVFVDDITVRSKAGFEARQEQVQAQIQFTREQLATSALRQRELDLEEEIRSQQSALLSVQTNYNQELGRQAESDAIGDRSSFSESELIQQAEVRTQLLRAISQQVNGIEANIEELNELLASVQAELATLPPDTDGSLSAAYTEAYSLQLSTLTEQYVTDQVNALTAGAPVLLYGDASTPFETQGIKKLGVFGFIGGMAVAGGLGVAFELLKKWRAARALRTASHDSLSDGGTATPEFERLLAMVNEVTARGNVTGGHVAGTGMPRPNAPTPAGD